MVDKHKAAMGASLASAHITTAPAPPTFDVGGTMSTITFDGGDTRNSKLRQRSNVDRRASHNAIERQRREVLNSRFLDLAAVLPALSNIRRPSKSSIVDTSIAHVQASQRHRVLATQQLQMLADECELLRSEVNEWRERAGGIAPLPPPVRGDAFVTLLSGGELVLEDMYLQAETEEGEEDLSPGMAESQSAQGDGRERHILQHEQPFQPPQHPRQHPEPHSNFTQFHSPFAHNVPPVQHDVHPRAEKMHYPPHSAPVHAVLQPFASHPTSQPRPHLPHMPSQRHHREEHHFEREHASALAPQAAMAQTRSSLQRRSSHPQSYRHAQLHAPPLDIDLANPHVQSHTPPEDFTYAQARYFPSQPPDVGALPRGHAPPIPPADLAPRISMPMRSDFSYSEDELLEWVFAPRPGR